MYIESYNKKNCVRNFIFSPFDAKKQNHGIKYLRKIKNLQKLINQCHIVYILSVQRPICMHDVRIKKITTRNQNPLRPALP